MNSITTEIKELNPKLIKMISSYVEDLDKPYVDKIALLQSLVYETLKFNSSSIITDNNVYQEIPKKSIINRDKTSGFIVNRSGKTTIYKKGHNGLSQKMSEVFRAFMNDEDILFGLDTEGGRKFFNKHMGNRDGNGKYRLQNTFPNSSGDNKDAEVRELKNVGGFYSTSNSTKDKMKYIISMCEDKGYGLEIISNE
jgi:hypothetical protein